MVFTLSAIAPEHQVGVLRSLKSSLKPGGVLCFRDRALYDLTMLRGTSRLGERTYSRSDGTLAHYFTEDEVERLACEAGLELVGPIEYHTVRMHNRRKGVSASRCFIHAKLRRPRTALELVRHHAASVGIGMALCVVGAGALGWRRRR